MKIKVLLTCFITLCLTYVGCAVLLAVTGHIDEFGYAGNFNEIPGLKEEKLFSPNIHTDGALFFQREKCGNLSRFIALHIIGKLTEETFEELINNPHAVGFPTPRTSYKDNSSTKGYHFYRLYHVPPFIANKLKLRKEKHDFYRCELDKNIVIFNNFGRKNYLIEIILLGDTRFFIATILHRWR